MSDTPYRSGEFPLPAGWTSAVTPAAVVFADRLWLVGGDSGGMKFATLPLVTNGKALAVETGAAAVQGNWTTGVLTIPGPNRPRCRSKPALAAVGDALVLCWNDVNGALMVSQYKVGADSKLAWQAPFTLVAAGDASAGGLVAGAGAEVALVGIDESTFILACPMVSAWWGQGAQTLFVGTFDVDDIVAGQTHWKAHTDIWGGPPPLPPFGRGYSFPSFGTSIGLDVFTVTTNTAEDPNEPTKGTPTSALWVTLAPGGASLPATIVMPLERTIAADGTITSYQVDYATAPGWSAPRGAEVTRDPAGRICTTAVHPGGGKVTVSTYSTWNVPTRGADPLLPKVDLDLTTPSIGAAGPAFAFFTDATTNITPHGTDKWIAHAVYRFTLYGDVASQQYCQVDRYGTAQVHPDYGTLGLGKPKAPHPADMMIVQGIVDGPIPLPEVNFADYKFADGPTVFAVLEYGHTDTVDKEHSVANSWTVGFKTEGEASKGVGPAWDVSLNGGMGSIKTDGTSTSAMTSQTQKSSLDGTRPTQTVDPRGTTFGTTVYFDCTAYRFLDADGVAIADGTDASAPQQAPLFTMVTSRFVQAGGNGFLPYAVRPGDLATYTREAIDVQMAKLGYPGTTYFADVIVPNAYTFGDGNNHIEMTWTSSGGQQTGTYSQATEQFTESSWSLDLDAYVGVSGGGGVSIFGIDIEEFSFKFLVGGTYSTETTTSDRTSHEWSIGLEEGWGELGNLHEPTMISAYTFQIYFLPPPRASDAITSEAWPAMGPTYWTRELQRCAPQVPEHEYEYEQLDPSTIDSNSGAWRLFFLVDSYTSFDGTIHYP